ncbi:diaminopimelate epimerase [Candidatus Actinomarina sp.]|nr:diaminopimelate epimerase [Candidatus Actinomarina sp.]MDA8667744.1 diaminopimelate epimerase [Candidatus Actinomarina sp.]MDA9845462.1 diaminopimelate epimerase [Acidimicrobiia bacterium]MDB2533012.1 diaminopimelate epimerase [Candidatus Actinomarina sp.]MDB2628337.1 diaminopimelate epimerase [Candidatus Actinomarina sp.]
MSNFAYMSGTGNDFIVSTYTGPTSEIQIISLVADSDYDVDGVIFVESINNQTVKMHYFNSDGTTAELCVNGVRCTAKYAYDNDLVTESMITVQAPVGTLIATIEDSIVKVSAPTPTYMDKPIYIDELSGIKAEIGNPHLLVEVDEVDSFDLQSFSKKVAMSNTFPDGVNVEIYQIINDNFIKTRVFERGVGETDACGSGALCLFNYAYSEKKVLNPTTIQFPGGELDLEYKNEEFFLSGTVTYL